MTYPLQAQGHSVDFPIIVPKYSHFPRLYSHFPHFQQIWQPEGLREAFPRPSLPAGRGRVSAAESACGQGPCFRVRVCLRAGTSDRCAPAVLSLPPLRGRSLPFTKPRAATPSEVPPIRHSSAAVPYITTFGCRDIQGKGSGAAVIANSWAEIGNRCKVMPVYDLLRAAILDFSG